MNIVLEVYGHLAQKMKQESANRMEQFMYSTNNLQNQEIEIKKTDGIHKNLVGFWQRMRDSNPRKRSQSPVCYRYTNPLFEALLLYAILRKSQEIF